MKVGRIFLSGEEEEKCLNFIVQNVRGTFRHMDEYDRLCDSTYSKWKNL